MEFNIYFVILSTLHLFASLNEKKSVFWLHAETKKVKINYVNFNMILCMLKKLLLLSVMPLAVYAMVGDSQTDAVNLSAVTVNGATIIAQDEQIDTTTETLHQATVQAGTDEAVDATTNAPALLEISQTPAPSEKPTEPTLDDIVQLIQNACDANNLTEANAVITQYTETLMASKEGMALGLRATIVLGSNANFYKLMRVESAAFKPDSDMVDQLLVTAATYGRSFHAESLFQYRHGIPGPSLASINDAVIAAAANGYPAFIDLLLEVYTRPSSEDSDWITKPNLRQMSLILSPYLCAAYLYYYANGNSTTSSQESIYHYATLTHFIRDLFVVNACVLASKLLTKPLIMKYFYNYKFASVFNLETMDKALLAATLNGQTDTVRWLLQDRSVASALGYKVYRGIPRPTFEGVMKSLVRVCVNSGIKNRLPILDKLLIEIPSFIKEDKHPKQKDYLNHIKLTLLLGTYASGNNDCAGRLRAENLPISQEFIDNQFELSLSIDNNHLMLFLAPNLPADLRVSREKVSAALDVPGIKDNPSFVNMIRLHLNPTPLMPFNNWVAALDMSKEPNDTGLNQDMPQAFKEILPPPSVSLRELLRNIFGNIDSYTDQNNYVWNVVNGSQLGGITEGLGQPNTWSEDQVITSAKPVIVACDDENALRFKDATGNNKTVEYMFQIAKMTGTTAEIIPIRLWPTADQDVSKGTPRSPVSEKENAQDQS